MRRDIFKRSLFKIIKDPFFLAYLSALLLRFSFPKSNLWILAWFAFVPLFFAVEGQKFFGAFLTGLLGGTLFFVFLLFWLVHVTVGGMLILSLYLGLYTASFILVYRVFKDKLTFWQRIFFVPSLWVFLEFLRSCLFTGFPWGLLAYSQTFNCPAIQAADLFGVYGVSFIVMFVNIVLFEFIFSLKRRVFFKPAQIFIPSLILICWFAYGAYRINEAPKESAPVKVSIIQGNIIQDIKWVPEFKDKILRKYRLLTELASLKDEPDLIIWPETSFPDYLEFGVNDKCLKDFARDLGRPLLVGAIRFQDMHYSNGAVLFSSLGRISGAYDKIHLVPFGEYIPLRSLLSFVEHILPIEDFLPGKKYEIFSIDKGDTAVKFAVLICFEDIFNDLARSFVRRGADFLVNITNDAWFQDTSSPHQHMQASVLRAVENRVFVVRAANTGISCIIDDIGRTQVTVADAAGKQAFVTGFKTGLVYKSGRSSIYTRVGNAFSAFCILYSLVIMLLCVFRRKA